VVSKLIRVNYSAVAIFTAKSHWLIDLHCIYNTVLSQWLAIRPNIWSTVVRATFNRWRTVVSGTWKYDALVWHFQPGVVIFPCPTHYRASYVWSYDQQQESWIISERNAIESETRDRLPSKNAHSPNFCSWLAACVNYSGNFYCKIALINRFKLYLIKILTVTSKKQRKQTKHKQKQRRIHLTFAFSEGYVSASRSPGVTL